MSENFELNFTMKSDDSPEDGPDMSEMQMSVSPVCGTGEDRYAFVTFTEGAKTAEAKIPSCEIIRSSGFSEEELAGLRAYMKADLKHLQHLAAGENVFKAMFKD
ncbi:MAG: hypothetical protein VZQ80_02505 [Lachnospiraceae bacterium]|nr:hypothetical protein [Lachnospiraceae bacterium]